MSNENKKKDGDKNIHIESGQGSINTVGQTGGNNTVHNYQQPAPPVVNLTSWSVKNEKRTTVPKAQPHFGTDDVVSKYGVDHLYFNEILVSYFSSNARPSVHFRIRKSDVELAEVRKQGVLQMRSGKNNLGEFIFQVLNPDNGQYVFKIYSRTEISEIFKVLEAQG